MVINILIGNINKNQSTYSSLKKSASKEFEIVKFILKYIDDNNQHINIYDTNDLHHVYNKSKPFEIYVIKMHEKRVPLHRFSAKDVSEMLCASDLSDNAEKTNFVISNAKHGKVDGSTMINYILDTNNEESSNGKEFEQIKLLYSKCISLRQEEFVCNMNKVFLKTNYDLLSKEIKDELKNFLVNDKINIEQIFFDVKNGYNINTFSEELLHFIESLITENEIDLRKIIYTFIAKCFIFSIDPIQDDDLFNQAMISWKCNNCSNNNYPQYIGGRLDYKQYNVANCKLCGITQISSILIKLKNYQSFISINSVDNNTIDNQNKEIEDDGDTKILIH